MANETILFVDNDVQFLEVRKEFLLRVGYQVVKAFSYDEAERILQTRNDLALAIIDMRLEDDNDEDDRSGIQLASRADPRIPKIILTGFPTWETVREALAIGINGVAPAVELIDKKEDPQALLRAVEWILHRSELRNHIIGAFEVSSLVALPARINSLGIDEAGRRLHKSFSETSAQWKKNRADDQKRATSFHKVGLITGILAIFFVFTSLVLFFLGKITSSTLPLVVSALTEPISIFFFMREDTIYKRIHDSNGKLDEINKAENLLLVCESLSDKKESEKLKRKVIEKLLDHWLDSR